MRYQTGTEESFTGEDGQQYCWSCGRRSSHNPKDCDSLFHYQRYQRGINFINNVIKRNKLIIDKIKNLYGCSRCGINDSRVLDFHHKNPSEKLFQINHERNKSSLSEILEEIKKCVVLCANCHRITEDENGYKSRIEKRMITLNLKKQFLTVEEIESEDKSRLQ